jgi:hypothetical protein
LLLVIFVLALLARCAIGMSRLVRSGDPTALEFPDEEQYWLMAQSLAQGDGLQDELGFRAVRMPLFPTLLAPFTYANVGVPLAKAFQWLIGAFGAAATAWAADRIFRRRVAWLAGLLMAFDPFLVFFSSLLLTETLFVAAVALLWGWAGPMLNALPARQPWRSWLILGALGALTVYVRETGLGLLLGLLALMVLAGRGRRSAFAGAAVAIGVVGLSLVPWAARNQSVTGDWCWLTHRGGISLYDGVGPQATGASDLADVKQMDAVRGMDEVAWNDYFLQASFEEIRSNPGRILELAGRKWARMWNVVPNAETYQTAAVRIVAAVWTIPTFALALTGVMLLLWRGWQGRWQVVFFLLPAIYLTAVHGLFVGSVRYRLGAIPMIAILAAQAIATLYDWHDRRLAEANTRAGDAPEQST